jgi:hypothetical protein
VIARLLGAAPEEVHLTKRRPLPLRRPPQGILTERRARPNRKFRLNEP